MGKLDLRNWREGDSPNVPSAEEGIPECIVLSVESGGTPLEVLLWIFPSFEGLLVDLLKDESSSM